MVCFSYFNLYNILEFTLGKQKLKNQYGVIAQLLKIPQAKASYILIESEQAKRVMQTHCSTFIKKFVYTYNANKKKKKKKKKM